MAILHNQHHYRNKCMVLPSVYLEYVALIYKKGKRMNPAPRMAAFLRGLLHHRKFSQALREDIESTLEAHDTGEYQAVLADRLKELLQYKHVRYALISILHKHERFPITGSTLERDGLAYLMGQEAQDDG